MLIFKYAIYNKNFFASVVPVRVEICVRRPRSVLAAQTKDPLLGARLQGEVKQMKRINSGLSKNLFVIPFRLEPPVGVNALRALIT